MGKKGKGTKKEEKPKKDPVSSKDKLREALEADEQRAKSSPPRATSRNAASKKNERSDVIKVGWTQSFRWDNNEEAPVLPPMPRRMEQTRIGMLTGASKQPRTALLVDLECLRRGWGRYLDWRCHEDPASLAVVRKSKTLKDGLSGPLTIASMVTKWVSLRSIPPSGTRGDELESGEPLHIVVVGATAVNEEKILRESDYWDELFDLLSGRKVHLYLTGPEMSGKDGVFKRTGKNKDARNNGQQKEEEEEEEERETDTAARRRVECWKANGIEFFLQRGRLDLFQKEETVVVGLNSGFGVAAMHVCHDDVQSQEESSNAVLWKWIPTLFFLAALDLPLMFTCSSVADSRGFNHVWQQVVGAYIVHEAAPSKTPFETSIRPAQAALGKEVCANSYFSIVQGQQPNYSFASQELEEHGGSDDFDGRIMSFRKLCMVPAGTWPKHVSIRKAGQQSYSIKERAPPLVPLKKYGNYPPEKKEEQAVPIAASSDREASKAGASTAEPTNEDAAESESDPLAVEGSGGTAALAEDGLLSPSPSPSPLPLPPEKVKLEHSVSRTVDGGSDALEMIVEGVLMTDPATARVGVKRDSIALYYFDCGSLRDVVFEAALPKPVDHSTSKVVFHRSKHSITLVVRLLESNK